MQGLRKREEIKFENFFRLVQAEANKQNCVFFLDNVESKLVEVGEFLCADMHGWLIHEADADLFEPEFMKNTDKRFDFDDFYIFVDFKIENNKVEIVMEEFPQEISITNEVKMK